MPGQGIGPTERAAETMIAHWARELTNATLEKYAWLALAKSRKKIKYNLKGGELRWVWRYHDHEIGAFVDLGPKQFQVTSNTKNANLPWRGWDANEAITLLEKLTYGGAETMVDVLANREQFVREGLIRRLGGKLYVDGGANSFDMHGIETFCASIGAQTAADLLATTLSDNYAGQSTSYTAHVIGPGTSTDPSDGYGTWSPVIVSTNRTPAGGSQRSWADYADEYLRYGILQAARGESKNDRLDMVCLEKDAYYDFLNLADDKERLVFKRGESVELVKLGFTDFVEWDGCMVGWDAGVPATDANSDVIHGYGFNYDFFELCLLGDQLWGVIVDWNMSRGADELYFYCLGNFKFRSPRMFAKWAAIA